MGEWSRTGAPGGQIAKFGRQVHIPGDIAIPCDKRPLAWI